MEAEIPLADDMDNFGTVNQESSPGFDVEAALQSEIASRRDSEYTHRECTWDHANDFCTGQGKVC